MEEGTTKTRTGIRHTGCLFCRYLAVNRYLLFLLGAVIFLVHGGRLFSTDIGIDTESIIHDEEALYDSWFRTGRYGLILLKYVTGTLHFNPFFDAGMTLVFLLAACGCFGFLFYMAGRSADTVIHGTEGEEHAAMRRSGWCMAAFGTILAAHPIITEQLYFALQSKEIALSLVLLAVCLYCSHIWAQDRKLSSLAVSVGIMLLVFATYQAMVPLYLAGAAAVTVLTCNARLERGRMKESIWYLVRLASGFLLGLGGNQLLTRTLCGTSTYLTDQIRWNRGNLMAGVLGSANHVAGVVTDQGSFNSPLFSLFAMLVFALSILRIRQKGWGKEGVWYMALLAALVGSPFYMALLLGGSPVIRAQLELPFVTGFLAYLAGILTADIRPSAHGSIQRGLLAGLQSVLVFLCLAGTWKEADNSSRLYYTQAVCSEQDRAIGESLKERIGEAAGTYEYKGKVMFVGIWEEEDNNACMPGDVCGRSLFDWDYYVEPESYWSSFRIIGFLHTLGAEYTLPDKTEAARALDASTDMPCFPAEGSVAIKDGIVIVKLCIPNP